MHGSSGLLVGIVQKQAPSNWASANKLDCMAFNLNKALFEAFRSHGADVIQKGDAIAIASHDLVASCMIFNHGSSTPTISLQLDLRVQSPKLGNRLLIESFGGFGQDEEEAAKNAFHKMMLGSFHVLLASLVDRGIGDEQVEWEDWSVADQNWRVCLGPLIVTDLDERQDLDFGGLLDELRDRLPTSLAREAHWLRVFYWRKGDESLVSEALLDNEPWPDGEAILSAWSWPNGDYRVRNFLLMNPT